MSELSESQSVALVPREASVELGTISAKNPAALVKQATEAANALADVIKTRKLFSRIQGKEFVRCEGWTTLAAMMGVLPSEVSVEAHEGTYTATVELRRMSDGAVLTRASAECGMDEKTWASRDAYARRSMAITRATSKACRIAFSWVMVLAGYEATPAEEIPDDERSGVPTGRKEPGAAQGGSPDKPSVTRELTLPGKPEKWDGNGGKRLSEVPTPVLQKAAAWLLDKADEKNNDIIAAIEAVVEGRRVKAQENFDSVPGVFADTRDELALDERINREFPAKAGSR